MFRRYPHIIQHDEKDCGAACLAMVASFHGAKFSISKIRELIKVDNLGANIYGLVEGAKAIGLEGNALEGSLDELIQGVKEKEIRFPAIARIVNEDNLEHYIVIYGLTEKKLIVGDPGASGISSMSLHEFKHQWQNQIVTFEPGDNFRKTNETKGSFTKFFKYITIQKKTLIMVFVLSLLISVVNVLGSTVFQYVFDGVTTAANEKNMEEGSCENHNECECEDHEHEEEHDQEEEYDHEEDHDHDHDIDGCDCEEDEVVISSEGASKFIDFLSKIENKLSLMFANLKTVCISMVILYLVSFLFSVIRSYLLAVLARRVDVPLTMNFYDHLINLPDNYYGTRKSGEFLSRFYDIGKIREAVSSVTLTILMDGVMVIGCGFILWFIDYRLFLITIGILLIYSVILFSFKKPIRRINHTLMEQEAQVTSYLKESIDGIETIKAFNNENNVKDKTERMYNDMAGKSVKASIIYSLQENLVGIIESVGLIALLATGAALCINNVISLADLMIYYYMLGYFISPVKGLINLQPEIQTAMVAAERINDILDVEKENKAGDNDISLGGDVSVDGIDFRYGNRDLVLEDLSMKFRKGQKTAIVGESGSGKTTLIKLLLKFYKPEQGAITIGGTDIQEISGELIRNKIAYVSQDIFLFSDSIYNNLRMGNTSITNEQIEEVCRSCFADEFISKLPAGYNTVLEENGNNLSGGQKQRLAIARALLKNPDIVILDEATSNLDTITEETVKKAIDNLSDKVTCIIIAHRLNTIRNCDYIYVMEDGKVVEEGTHEALINKRGVYASYNLQ